MSDNKIETTQGLCVVALTRHLMEKYSLPQDKAYAKLIQTELYSLLMDSDTNLFLETNDYLIKASDLEMDIGMAALYKYINAE